MVLGGPLFFWEVEERQGPEELRCSDRVQPEVQGSKISRMVRALEKVLYGVVLPSAARADCTPRQAHPMPVVFKGWTKSRSQYQYQYRALHSFWRWPHSYVRCPHRLLCLAMLVRDKVLPHESHIPVFAWYTLGASMVLSSEVASTFSPCPPPSSSLPAMPALASQVRRCLAKLVLLTSPLHVVHIT